MKKLKQASLVVAIDPAAHGSGISMWFEMEPVWRAWKCIGSTGTKKNIDQIEAIEILRNLAGTHADEPCFLIIETWTTQRGRAAVESLAASQKMWISAAERVFPQVRVFKVNSQTWQSQTGVLRAKKLAGSTKGVTARLAADMRPGVRMTEDEADAVVIGNWWLSRGALVAQEQWEAEKKDKRRARLAKQRREAEDADAAIAHYQELGLL